jgi:hypothetical protein
MNNVDKVEAEVPGTHGDGSGKSPPLGVGDTSKSLQGTRRSMSSPPS